MMNQSLEADTGAKLVIMENESVFTVLLEGKTEWTVGRTDGEGFFGGVITLHSPIISRIHGKIRKIADFWYYIDNPRNTNGTLYNGGRLNAGHGEAAPVRLFEGDILRIDNQKGMSSNPNAVLLLFTTAPTGNQWKRYSIHGKREITIGRSPRCDIVQSLPYISAVHAKITVQNGGYYLSDCGSKAGTYLNRQRVTNPVRLRDKDCFRLADRAFFLLGDAIICISAKTAPTVDANNQPVILRANICTKRVKDQKGIGMRELLRDVQLEIRQGTLVAMLGTAGAGKTTVMNCLNGMDLQGVDGSVIYRNVDMLTNFAQMKSLIGSVPQQKVFHKTFTPKQELWFAAKKRLPGDTTKEEIDTRVRRTLELLSIQGVSDSPNCKLSGGEQTRVNVGIELVADRDLLCLDEPDQGLSPNYKHELFVILRKLAHENGKTMLTIIHDVSEIDMFDQVIMLAKKDGVGRLAFSGTPQEARQFFGVDIRDAYSLLDKYPERYIR